MEQASQRRTRGGGWVFLLNLPRIVRYAIAASIPILHLYAAEPAPPLAVRVEEHGVRVDNLTPGGDVILFSSAKRARNESTFSEALARILSDSDGDGVVILNEPIPLTSVWVAIDSTTGALGTGAHAEFPIYVRPIAPALYRKDAEDQIAALEQSLTRVGLLLVRPRQGAWMLRGREGAYGDSDGAANNRLLMAFGELLPVGGGKEKAPKQLKAGDVIVAIDLGQLDIFIAQVTK